MASTVNLRFGRGAIGNVESYVQCLYGYDVRTEIVGFKGVYFHRNPAAKLSHILPAPLAATSWRITSSLAFGMLTSPKSSTLSTLLLSDRAPRVTGEDGLRAVEIAVAAEKSYRTAAPCPVGRAE